MGIFAKIFGLIGGLNTISNSTNTACWVLFYDEPECPKCMIEK